MPFALVMLLASCGGGSKSSKETVSVAGATGASGPTSTQGPDHTSPTAPRPSTTRHGKTAHGTSGTSKRPPASKNSAIEQLKRKAARIERRLAKNRKRKPSAPSKTAPASKPGANPQEVLARKAKRVCESIGLDGLAKRFNVAPTAEAVATAYASSYPPTLRTAIHDGCKSAFPRQ